MSALVALYVLLNLLLLGYLIDIPLRKYFPQFSVLALAQQYLLVALVILLILELFFERKPRVDLHSFLCLPITKTSITISYLLRVLGGKLNLAPALVVFPFWLKHVWTALPPAAAGAWLMGFLLLRLCFTSAALLLRMELAHLNFGALLVVGAILLACCFDLAASQSALQFASNYFFAALQHGNMAMLAACFILALSLWGLAYQRLRTQLYLDLKF